MLPAVFASIALSGTANIPLLIGTFTLAVPVVAAIACWSARETCRIHMNDPGNPDAVPVPKPDYDRIREKTLADGQLAQA